MLEKVTATELRRRMENGSSARLIDVRSAREFAAGHLPTAMNIPMEELESRLEDISADVVLICQGGTRAALCYAWLADKRKATVLEGGTSAWQSAKFPLVRCTRSRWSLERQTRLGAGLLILMGTTLSLLAGHSWILLAMFIGAGLTFAGVTDICGMGLILAKMPWNRAPKKGKTCSSTPLRCQCS